MVIFALVVPVLVVASKVVDTEDELRSAAIDPIVFAASSAVATFSVPSAISAWFLVIRALASSMFCLSWSALGRVEPARGVEEDPVEKVATSH